jgi:penicillin-binding protein 2
MIIFDQLKKNDPHLRAITWGVLVGLGILVAGLWWVQIISYRQYSENQKMQSFRTVRIPAIRGKIFDRNTTPLAENKPSYNVILYLDDLRDLFSAEYARSRPVRSTTNSLPFWKRWLGFGAVQTSLVKLKKQEVQELTWQSRYRVVSNIVQQVATTLQQPIPFSFDDFMRHYTNQLALPMPIVVGLDERQVARLLERSVNPRGVDLEVQPVRFYRFGSAAAHILGYLRQDNRSMEGEVADFNFRLPDYRGHVGIEGQFDSELRGKAGVKSVLVNSLGYRQSENVWAPAEPGQNVVLTIDVTIQQAAESALQSAMSSTRGAVVVMDPNNGDVLALASCPTYDPNIWMRKISAEEWTFLNDPVLKPQIDRAMQENYAPGSIFKVVTGLAALEAGIDPDQKIYNPGWIRVPGRRTPIDDLAKPGEYNFRDAFIHSSNTYFITNGMRAGIEAIVRLGMRLHLGERTFLLPKQETAGTLPSLPMVRRGWTPPDTAYICIGQGRLDVTPLQMAIMVGAIANGGKVLWPRLVQRVEPPEPHNADQVILYPTRDPRDELGVSPRSLEITREGMLGDVEEGGTGKRALVPGMRICGKTGTAQVMDARNNVIGHTVWFASYAPFDNPRYVVVVMIEGDRGVKLSGGETCAPVAARIYRAIQKLEQQARPSVARNN